MKMHTPFTIAMILCSQFLANAQSLLYNWSRTFNTVEMGPSSCWGKVAHQSTGNVLHLNWLNGQQPSLDIDPGPGEFILNYAPNSSRDYINCFDGQGNFLWARVLGTGGYINGIVVDHEDNIYITGNFDNEFTISDGKNDLVLNCSVSNNSDLNAGYVLKLDSFGNFEWIRQVSAYSSIPKVAAINTSGHLVIAGKYIGFENVSNDFDPGPEVLNLNNPEHPNAVFVLEIDPVTGENLQFMDMSSLYPVDLGSLFIDENEHLWLSGMGYQEVDFDPGSGEVLLQNIISGADNYDFLVAYDWSQNVLHSMRLSEETTIGTTYRDPLPAAHLGDRIYLASNGALSGDIDPGDGTFELDGSTSYVMALDTSGNFIWANAYESATINAIAITANNNPILLGGYSNTLEFNPDSPLDDITSMGNFDAYYVSFKRTNGQIDRITSLGGEHTDRTASMSFASNGQMVYCGCFQGDVDLRPGFGADIFDAGDDYDYNGFITALSYYFVGVEDLHHPFDAIQIYPVPASEELMVRFSDKHERIEWLHLSDMQGRIVKTDNPGMVDTAILDVSDLQAGVYTLSLKTGKSIYHRTLVVE